MNVLQMSMAEAALCYKDFDMKQREEAFLDLEKLRKKVPDLDYDKELAEYREEKYGIADIG